MSVEDLEQTSEDIRTRGDQAWARWMARSLDNVILLPGVLLAFIALGVAAAYGRAPPQILEWAQNPLLSTIMSLAIMFVLLSVWEPVFLSSAGTTPGKWVMGIRVRDAQGKKLSFFKALMRTWSVWLFGLGLGIPLVQLITALIARAKLVSEGATGWDQMLKISVTHRRRNVAIWILVLVLVLAVNIGVGILSRFANE